MTGAEPQQCDNVAYCVRTGSDFDSTKRISSSHMPTYNNRVGSTLAERVIAHIW
jgi:hypothetical protein